MADICEQLGVVMQRAASERTKRKASPKYASGAPSLDALSLRLHRHALRFWAENCQALSVEAKGRFFYIGATMRESPPQYIRKAKLQVMASPTSFKLCRVAYTGRDDQWEFAFYKYSDEKYEPCMYPSGSFEGTPEEAFDCAADVYLLHG